MPIQPSKKPPAVYRSGPTKGLPKFCTCGGLIHYEFGFNRVWSHCAECTPGELVKVRDLDPRNK